MDVERARGHHRVSGAEMNNTLLNSLPPCTGQRRAHNSWFACVLLGLLGQGIVPVWADEDTLASSPQAKVVKHDESVFSPDPSYEDKPYSDEAQLKIYGGKFSVQTPRPLLELGRPIYTSGPLSASGDALGAHNPTDNAFSVYGDWRTAVASNNGGTSRVNDVATRVNLDIDYKFTSTERVHAFVGPLDNGKAFTNCTLNGSKVCQTFTDFNLDTLFFEGDMGAIMGPGATPAQSFDLPFAVGRMPLLMQNGVWMEDIISGMTVTVPARSSTVLDISNMDVTFFAGKDASAGGVRDATNAVAFKQSTVAGVTAFIEANQGYWEMGWAHTDAPPAFNDQSYNNVGLAYTSRYAGLISNSVRLIDTYGQNRQNASNTANGSLLLIENSFITSSPSTLVPYSNFFFGHDHPQSVERAANAGGILKNTGINFETDGLTGFPKLTDNANNMRGGALGTSYLFALDQQLVIEWAWTQPIGDPSQRTLVGNEKALGIRYQRNLDKRWIFRTDLISATRENNTPLSGVRFEIRAKF